MSLLSPRLHLKVAQKQILTPSLVQMVKVLQMNRLELKDAIGEELAQNPLLEEGGEGAEELTPEEIQAFLEAERIEHPSDEDFLKTTESVAAAQDGEFLPLEPVEPVSEPAAVEPQAAGDSVATEQSDPFDEIDFGSFFDDYLDPGFRSPASESPDRPSFETFLSAPETLSDHLQSQLSLLALSEPLRDAADSIIGNLDENGYLTMSLEELAAGGEHKPQDLEQALKVVQSLEPAGVAARNVQECLLLQLESRNGKGGVAWRIVSEHLNLLETHQLKELARVLDRPLEHIQKAVDVVQKLDPRPGLRYSGPGAREIEPDVSIIKEGDEYIIQLNDDDLPQLRLNPNYRRLLDREQEPSKEVRNYVKERFTSAMLLIKNIEQRKQTILKVCQSVVRRQREFLDHGIANLRPMMIKEVAEEIGVHPSTVSRAVSNKYAHTPQGVFELREFFSEAVQGPAGSDVPLPVLKLKVKKMIEQENPAHPLTDDLITQRLRGEGIDVTRRTVAKYREDMKIPSTHQRRRRD